MIWLNPTSAPSGPVLKQTSVPSFFPSLQASDCLRGVLCARDIQRISKKWQSLPQDQATAVHHFHPPTMQSKPQSGHFKVFANNSSGIYQHLRLTEMICFTLSLYTFQGTTSSKCRQAALVCHCSGSPNPPLVQHYWHDRPPWKPNGWQSPAKNVAVKHPFCWSKANLSLRSTRARNSAGGTYQFQLQRHVWQTLDLTNKLYVSDVLLPLFDFQKETLIYFSSLKVSQNLSIHFCWILAHHRSASSFDLKSEKFGPQSSDTINNKEKNLLYPSAACHNMLRHAVDFMTTWILLPPSLYREYHHGSPALSLQIQAPP